VVEFQNSDKKEEFIVESGRITAVRIQELISALIDYILITKLMH